MGAMLSPGTTPLSILCHRKPSPVRKVDVRLFIISQNYFPYYGPVRSVQFAAKEDSGIILNVQKTLLVGDENQKTNQRSAQAFD